MNAQPSDARRAAVVRVITAAKAVERAAQYGIPAESAHTELTNAMDQQADVDFIEGRTAVPSTVANRIRAWRLERARARNERLEQRIEAERPWSSDFIAETTQEIVQQRNNNRARRVSRWYSLDGKS